mmetsp:Transcript_30569/g.97547  ORF Transcript_30569/g.97547 Transcript_30569/m.97547 type:complete len:376 (+) Transcript_30569:552-1679(+)
MYSESFPPTVSLSSCRYCRPPFCTKVRRASTSCGSSCANCRNTYFCTLMGESRSSGCSACRCVHLASTALSDRRLFILRSSDESSCTMHANRCRSTSASASARAWSGVCRPIWPSDQAQAALMWSSGSSTSASFSGATPLDTMIASASVSLNAAMKPSAMMDGSLALPGASDTWSTSAAAPPELTMSLASSGVCLATSRTAVAAFLRTSWSLSLRQLRIFGKISASTTTSARSTECLAICARQPQTWRFSLASGCAMSGARYATEPASTTACASSGECLQMSLIAEAEMRLSVISGSWRQSTRSGTAPASTTDCAREASCWAMYPMAQAADSFTVGSNSSRHGTSASSAWLSTTACARSGECLATARSTKAAAFL